MELWKILLAVAGFMILSSGWLTLSFWCAFRAAAFGRSKSEPLGWFLYFATASTMLVGGIVTFAYIMAKLTGEL